MNTLAILGYLIAMCLAPVAPFIVVRWVKRAVSTVKALRVLSRERRTGETLYDAAEALAGDAHNWRGLVDASDDSGSDLSNAEPAPVSGVYTKAQPPPQNLDGPALWPLIISELGDSETDRLIAADMQERHEFGMAKYGVPLVASNGRDHLADAYQEALDGVVYLRAELEKLTDRVAEHQVSPEDYKAHGRVGQLYIDMLDMAKEIRELIHERDGK